MDFFLIWIVPALILGGIGLLLFVATHQHIKRCRAISSWSKTGGKVQNSTVEEHNTRRYNRRMRASYGKSTFLPRIEYLYEVMGMPFRSMGYQNFAGTYPGLKASEAAEIVANYPPGKEVTVTYDPNNPSDAYLLPETDTSNLVKNRMGQLVMIAIALVWIGVGAVLNLTKTLSEKASENRIHESTGLLPGSPEDFYANLDPLIDEYQLSCQDEATSGYELAYHVWACRSASDKDLTSLEILNRKEDLKKVDMLSAIFTPSDQEATITYFIKAASLVFEGADLESAQTWIADSVPIITSNEKDTLETSIAGIALNMADLGGTIRLNIGDLR